MSVFFFSHEHIKHLGNVCLYQVPDPHLMLKDNNPQHIVASEGGLIPLRHI